MSEQRIRIRIATPPHCDKQRLIMNAFAIPGLLEMWVAGGSKFGKTFSMSANFVLTLPLSQQALYRWIAPVFSQSKIGWDYTRRMLPGEPYVKSNETHLTISMPHNDSKIQYFHGQYPETLEGEATRGNGLDEAAKLKEQVYYSVKTTTTVTAGPILGFSTPKGKNWFYKKCMEAKEEMIRARFEKRRPTKVFIHAASWENPFLSKLVLEDARKTMPDRLFRQYYGAEFLDESGVFTNVEACWNTDYLEVADMFQWYAHQIELKDVVIGVDWARNVDFTVFIAMEPKTREVVGIWRMRSIDYTAQIKRLVDFSKKFRSVLTVWHDKTGVGVGIHDFLGKTDLPFHGFIFTNASKNEIMVSLMMAFEQAAIHMPHIDKLAGELDDLEVKTSITGLPTYSAIQGSHDDIVMALGLSHAAMLQHCDRDYGIIEF